MANNMSDSSAASDSMRAAETKHKRRLWIWIVVILVVGVGLTLLVKKARGRSEWETYRDELAARGEHLDWAYYIPPAVPDAENFYAAPEMQKLFQKLAYSRRNSTSPSPPDSRFSWTLPEGNWSVGETSDAIIKSPNGKSYPISVLLEWEKNNAELLKLFAQASARPKSRLLTDYSKPFDMDMPNYVNFRSTAQAFSTLAQAHLVKGNAEKAFQYLAGMQRLIDVLEPESMLVSTMIRVAIVGLYVDTVRFGLENHGWTDDQLKHIEVFLARARCLPPLALSLRAEGVAVLEMLKTRPINDLSLQKPRQELSWAAVKDYVEAIGARFVFSLNREKNYLNYMQLMMAGALVIDGQNERLDLMQSKEFSRQINSLPMTPGTLLAAIAAPNFTKAGESAAKNQTLADEAMLACVLERFHRAKGNYPVELSELVPAYIPKLPHDVINGKLLSYRRTSANTFLLYGVGLDETDDAGDTTKDWVWDPDQQAN